MMEVPGTIVTHGDNLSSSDVSMRDNPIRVERKNFSLGRMRLRKRRETFLGCGVSSSEDSDTPLEETICRPVLDSSLRINCRQKSQAGPDATTVSYQGNLKRRQKLQVARRRNFSLERVRSARKSRISKTGMSAREKVKRRRETSVVESPEIDLKLFPPTITAETTPPKKKRRRLDELSSVSEFTVPSMSRQKTDNSSTSTVAQDSQEYFASEDCGSSEKESSRQQDSLIRIFSFSLRDLKAQSS